MIFNFKGGRTKEYPVGDRFRGLKDTDGTRPMSVTLTEKDLRELLSDTMHVKNLLSALDITKGRYTKL